MKKAIIILGIFILHFPYAILNAQVSINSDNSAPDPSAMLDVSSADKGLLIPRLTNAQLQVHNSYLTISDGSYVIAQNGLINTNGASLTVDGTLSTPADLTNTTSATLQGNQDFFGVKIGDVVEVFADPANFGGGSSMEPLVWRVQDRILEAGQDIQVTFAADFLEKNAAFQFSLRFDTQYLELEDVEQLATLPLGDDHFGLLQAHLGEFRAVWAHHDGFELPHGSESFQLHFKVLGSGVNLSSVLDLDEALLPGIVYNNQFEQNEVQLHFNPVSGAQDIEKSVLVFDTWPNPFVHTTNVRFNLSEAKPVQLEIFDLQGRLLRLLQSAELDAGLHNIEWNGKSDSGNVLQAGSYFVRLIAGSEILVHRVVLLDEQEESSVSGVKYPMDVFCPVLT